MKTLITGGKSSQALKILKAFPGNTVLLADYGEIPAFSSANYQFVGLGARNDETIAHNLLNVCLDHDVEQVIPLHVFELEAVVKSAVLFQEFNIHVLLPALNSFSQFQLSGAANLQNWAIYKNGELVYTNATEQLPADTSNLNGVYFLDQTPEGLKYILFAISE